MRSQKKEGLVGGHGLDHVHNQPWALDVENFAARPRSVTLNNALTTCSLEAAAELVGLAGRRERAHHDSVINPLGAKIGAPNDGCPASEVSGEFLLQRAQGRLRVGFAPLR